MRAIWCYDAHVHIDSDSMQTMCTQDTRTTIHAEGGVWYVRLVCPYDVRTVSIRRPYDVRTMSRRMSVVCPWYVPFTPVRCPYDVRTMPR